MLKLSTTTAIAVIYCCGAFKIMKIIYQEGYEPSKENKDIIEKSKKVEKYVSNLIKLGIVRKNVNVICGCMDGEYGYWFDAPYGVFENMHITINDGYCEETVWISLDW